MVNISSVNVSDLDCPEISKTSQLIVEGVDFWIQGVLQTIFAVFGIFFNILFSFVLAHKELRNSFNILLIVLSCFDTCYLIGSILESIRISFELATSLHLHLFPYFLYPAKAIAMTGSIFMTVAISFERYVAVHNPIDYNLAMNDPRATRRRVTKFMIPVLMLVMLFSINKFFEARIRYRPSGPNNETMTLEIIHTEFRVDPDYVHKINWSRFFVLGVIPVALLIYFNRKIYQDVKERENRRRPINFPYNNGNSDDRHLENQREPGEDGPSADNSSCVNRVGRRRVEDKMALLFMGIVLAFLICNFPRIYLNFHEIMILDNAMACHDAGKDGFPVWFWITTIFSHLLLVINSSLNMFVYCLYNTKFREVARYIFTHGCCRISRCTNWFKRKKRAASLRNYEDEDPEGEEINLAVNKKNMNTTNSNTTIARL